MEISILIVNTTYDFTSHDLIIITETPAHTKACKCSAPRHKNTVRKGIRSITPAVAVNKIVKPIKY